MTDRPIIFSGPMVRALLDGTKTQTRRLLKPQPRSAPIRHDGVWTDCDGFKDGPFGIPLRNDVQNVKIPIAVGDRLWVRENCRAVEHENGQDAVEYITDGGCCSIRNNIEASDQWGALYHYGRVGPNDELREGAQVPSIHMPRWASRLTLTVTDVRVQRLQDISRDDCIAEGITETKYPNMRGVRTWKDYGSGRGFFTDPRDSFHTLWDSLNADRALWSSNPWVAAYTFTVEKQNIDRGME